VRSARACRRFRGPSEKSPQVYSKRRVVKTASKISASTGFAVLFRHEQRRTSQTGTSARIRDEEHLERAFSRDASSAGDCLHARGVQYLAGISWQRRIWACQLARKANSAPPLRTIRSRSDLIGLAAAARVQPNVTDSSTRPPVTRQADTSHVNLPLSRMR